MNRLDLKGRVAVITGGAQGIGLGVALRILQSGGTVALWDLNAALLGQALEALRPHGTATATVIQLTDLAAVDSATQEALDAHGSIDILVNNAGITGGNAPTWELDPAVWRQVIDVNLIAPYLACRAVVPQMIKQGYGRIINVASIAGKEGNANASHYSASKAGLIGLTKSLAKELATKGVLVNAVTPAAAKTAIFDSMPQSHIDFMLSKIPMGRFLRVDEVASMICWLATEDCAFSTGAVFDVSGGRATY